MMMKMINECPPKPKMSIENMETAVRSLFPELKRLNFDCLIDEEFQ